MKLISRIIPLFTILLIGLTASTQHWISAEEGQSSNSHRIEFDQQYNNYDSDGEPRDTYYQNEKRAYNINFRMSSEETSRSSYSIRIDIDNEYMDDFTNLVRVGKPQGAKDIRYELEDGKYIIYVDFDNVTGGAIYSLPVEFRMKEASSPIPINYEHAIKASLLDSNGDTVQHAEDIYFYTKYDEPTFVHEATNKRVFIGFVSSDGQVVDGTKSDYARFTYATGSPSVRKVDRYKIVHHLTNGAVFDPDLEIDGVRVNEDWVLSDDGQSVSRITDSVSTHSVLSGLSDKTGNALYLSYTNKKNGDVGTSTADMYFYLKDPHDHEPEYYLKSSHSQFSFRTLSIGSTFTKKGYGKGAKLGIPDNSEGKRNGYSWTIEVQNPSETITLKDLTISDYQKKDGSWALDENMKISSINFNNITNAELANTIKEVRYHIVTPDGDRYVVTKTPDDFHRLVPDHTVGIEIDLHDIAPRKRLLIHIRTTFKDPDNIQFDEKNEDNNIFFNEATLHGNISTADNPSHPFQVTDSDYVPLVEYKEYVTASRYVSSNGYMVGDDISSVGPVFTFDVDPMKIITDMQVIHVIPEGVELNRYPVRSSGHHRMGDVQVEYDYNGTGKTVVIVNYPDITFPRSTSLWPFIQGTVTNLSDGGRNYIDSYLTGSFLDDTKIRVNSSYLTDDTNGFNPDTVKSSKIVHVQSYYNYLPVKEVTVDKYTRTAYQNGWLSEGALSDFDTDFDHRLEVVNYLDSNITDIMLYDVFPHPDDVDIVANDNGERQSRQSKFRTHLTGPLQVPKGFTAYYTTSTPKADPSESVKSNYWQTKVSDYADVTAIKVEMDQTKELSSKETVTVIAPMRTPKPSGDLKYTDRAYNSFAVSTTKGRTFTESNPSYVELHKKIDIPVQKVWKGNEQESVQIRLYGDGKLVGSKTITAEDDWKTTFTDVVYHNTNGQEINYVIKEAPIKGYMSTITGDKESGFTVTNSDLVSVDVRKIWAGEKQDSITVELYANTDKVATQTIRASDDWRYTFTDLPSSDKHGNTIVYDVREVGMSDYHDEVVGNMHDGFIITNTQKVVLNIDNIQIYTGDAQVGLPLKLNISALQGSSDIFDNISGNEKFTLKVDEMKRDDDGHLIPSSATNVIHDELTLDDLTDTLTYMIPSSGLSDDDVKAYRATVTTSDKLLLIGTYGRLDADGYTASHLDVTAHTNVDLISDRGVLGEEIDIDSYNREDSRVQYYDDRFIYDGVIMTERVAGEPTLNEPYPSRYHERISMVHDMDDETKSGYGVRAEGLLQYDIIDPLGYAMSNSQIESTFDNVPDIASIDTTFIYNNALVDDITGNILQYDYDSNRKAVTMENTSGSTHSYIENRYQLPALRLGIDNILYNKDDDMIETFRDAGRHLYIPIWIDKLGLYHTTFRSDASIGINQINFEITRPLDVIAYMFGHIDSETTDLDEILIHQYKN